MAYETIKNQPGRLGEFEGSDGVDYINAVGSIITGVVGSVYDYKKVARQSKDTRAVAINETIEATKKLGLQVSGTTEQARIAAEQAKSKYRTIPVVIAASGTIVVGVILASAWAYNKIVGDYEIEYQ